MEKIYSKQDPGVLLHMIVRKEDITPGRQDVVPEENFIQCSILNMEEGKTLNLINIFGKRGLETLLLKRAGL
jgi:hypothetical protein